MAKMNWKISLVSLYALCNAVTAILLRDFDSGSSNDTDEPWQCLAPRIESENILEMGESMFECTKKSLYADLMNNIDSNYVDVGDGITFSREGTDHPATREIYSTGHSATIRGLLDAYSHFLSQRSARWDLGFVYPGLVLRIGPTLTGSGIMEFGLEKRLDYHDRTNIGPGHMIIRRTILPHLLGFRMNLSRLLPLIIGLILVATKNAFVFSKVTLVMSILLTLKSLFLLQAYRHSDNHVFHHLNRPPTLHDPVDFDDSVTITANNRPRPHGYSFSESLSDAFLAQILKKLPDQEGVLEKSLPKRSRSGNRNFSWERKR